MASKKAPDEAPRFDAILEALEKIVQALEQGDLPLEEALAAFEQGIKLTRDGERILGEAEKRVELLLHVQEGEPELVPFEEAAGRQPDRSTP
jgi:exodeoxyribonuclease VII small subunit